MCLCSILSPVIGWLDGFIRTPGFAGLAALGAAIIAYRGARESREAEDDRARESRSAEDERARQSREADSRLARQGREAESKRAREARWWEQARWAADRVREDAARGRVPGRDEELAVGQIALAHLLVAAEGTDAREFASQLMAYFLRPTTVDSSPAGSDTQGSDSPKEGAGGG